MEKGVIAYALQIPEARAALWAPLLTEVARIYRINTPQRQACFLSQVGHETGGFRYLREIWGPTAQQRRYEPVTTLSKTLGNTLVGDGKRHLGRGGIQTTGRANYLRLTQRLQKRFPNCPDFIADPAALERPFWAAMAAGDYWEMRNLNKYADEYDFAGLTKKVNGGLTGLAERQAIYTRAYTVLIFSNY